MIMAFAMAGAWMAPAGYAAMGWAIGSTIGQMVDSSMRGPVQMPTQFGPRMGDNYVMQSQYGQGIPRQYGWGRISGNVLWASGITETSHSSSTTVGGKGGGSSSTITTVTYTYSMSAAVAVCSKEVHAIVRIWADDTLIYDIDDPNNANITTVLVIYTGTETQAADPTMQAALGVSNTPAYLGMAYVVFPDLQITQYGNRLPNFWFEINGEGVEV